jgi:hypothetical protein
MATKTKATHAALVEKPVIEDCRPDLEFERGR